MAKEVTLKQLRYFVAAADTGQFSMAATVSHVSQSAVTNAVLQLEDAVGVRLFERLPHGVILTPEGSYFYQHARHVLDTVQDALREPRFRRYGIRGKVHIATSYTFLGYFLPELLARFRTSYPDVEVVLHEMDRIGVEQAVQADAIEMGIVLLSNMPDTSRFVCHTLVRSRRQLWMSDSHPLLEQASLSLAEVAAYPYLQLTIDESEASTRRYWQANGCIPDIVFRTSSMEALRGLVAHGFGVTMLSDMVYRPWSLEGKRIEARPVLGAIPHMEVGLICRPGQVFSAAADAFQQFLIQACANGGERVMLSGGL